MTTGRNDSPHGDAPDERSFVVPCRTVAPGQIVHWLRRGWRDFMRARAPALSLRNLHGQRSEQGSMLIVEAIITLARGLGLQVLAEQCWELLTPAAAGAAQNPGGSPQLVGAAR